MLLAYLALTKGVRMGGDQALTPAYGPNVSSIAGRSVPFSMVAKKLARLRFELSTPHGQLSAANTLAAPEFVQLRVTNLADSAARLPQAAGPRHELFDASGHEVRGKYGRDASRPVPELTEPIAHDHHHDFIWTGRLLHSASSPLTLSLSDESGGVTDFGELKPGHYLFAAVYVFWDLNGKRRTLSIQGKPFDLSRF